MPTLVFRDRGYEVATQSWTACANGAHSIDVAYIWGADSISFFASSTGVSRAVLPISFDDLLLRLAKGHPVLDLRDR